MGFCWFAQADAPGAVVPEAELRRIGRVLAAVPGATEALLYTPGATRDPYLDDGAPPPLAVQVCFAGIAALEAAVGADGALMALADPATLPSLAGAAFAQQAMVARRFAAPDPVFRTPPGKRPCTYLVAYAGEADDPAAWMSHYLAHHAPIMTRFPGVRRVEVYTRLDWCGGLPWPRASCLQRNKVAFDDAEALTAALNSPVRHAMRADFGRFPPFAGTVGHFPMETRILVPGAVTT